jgi:hypothetical protein
MIEELLEVHRGGPAYHPAAYTVAAAVGDEATLDC